MISTHHVTLAIRRLDIAVARNITQPWHSNNDQSTSSVLIGLIPFQIRHKIDKNQKQIFEFEFSKVSRRIVVSGVTKVKWSASLRWLFGPNSSKGSIESTYPNDHAKVKK